MKGLISLSGMSRNEIDALLDEGDRYADALMRSEPFDRVLTGTVVTNAFFEASTRTRLSFQRAAMALGADILSLDPEVSATQKGESLRDSLLTLTALGTEILIIRHAEDDAPLLAAEWTGLPVINAGAGRSEHPTQTLLDALTIRRHFGHVEGLEIGIVGDIANSRVAAGLITTLPELGARLRLIGPEEFLPVAGDQRLSVDLDEHLSELDIVYLLRVQHERGAVLPPDYVERFGMGASRARMLKETAVVMHPGPLNRGVEITDDVADGPRSLILSQVRHGVPMRMAVLAATGGSLP